jgi:hypothetical protein
MARLLRPDWVVPSFATVILSATLIRLRSGVGFPWKMGAHRQRSCKPSRACCEGNLWRPQPCLKPLYQRVVAIEDNLVAEA